MMTPFLISALLAVSSAQAEPAVLQDIQVGAQEVTLKLTRLVGYRASRKANPPAVIITLDDTSLSDEARDKSSASMVVAGIESLPITEQGSQSTRVIVKLDKVRDFFPEWSGNDLVIKFKDPIPAEKAPAPRKPAAKPAAAPPAAPATPAAAAPAASAAPVASAPLAVWRIKGKLADKDGKPLEGSHAVAFRIKDGASQDLWSEWLKVNAKAGTFWAVLGKANPLPESFEGAKLVAETDAGTITIPVFHVQVASFPAEDTAKKLQGELKPKLGAVTIRAANVAGKKIYRVLLGPTDRAGAQDLFEKAKGLGHAGLLLQD